MSLKNPTAKELHSALCEAMDMASQYAKRIAPEVEEEFRLRNARYDRMRQLVNNWREQR